MLDTLAMHTANDNLSSIVTYIARSPDVCWRALIDATVLPAWVPGLRRARVIEVDDHQRPREVLFEFSTSLTYSLVYSYDADAREMHWEPRIGKRDAVRGFARLERWKTGH